MTNLLSLESSPYLRQHADNPVDWRAWNAASLQLARDQDKPILLSIGYSACHWCHVMAHESFEDGEVADLMNRHFINIKVDREERPDLDQIYQSAHLMLTKRSGGWPLTMFLLPDGTPFFGGTYFPRQARHGLPAFPALLQRVAFVYATNPSELAAQGQHLLAALADTLPKASKNEILLDDAPLALAVNQHKDNFDSVNGGFGGAPKFLHPAELDLLLRRSQAAHDTDAAQIVQFTLQQMAAGGLYDQLGGGFCRYSVDERWDIPHFEKMLYDNGLLLALYSDAWQDSGKPMFARVVAQTAEWVMREMQSAHGGYFSSLDADSEHQEGKYYVWQRDEVRQLLSADEYALFAPYYGLDRRENFEHYAWNLRISAPLKEIAQRLNIPLEQAIQQLASAQAKLFAAREQRVRPGRDEKILASWNGLMIAGMARAARVFDRPDWLHSAQRAMDFVYATLWRDGKLLATCKDGADGQADKAHLAGAADTPIPSMASALPASPLPTFPGKRKPGQTNACASSTLNAYLDDHAFLLNAALELLQTEYRTADMTFAVQLADALLEHFEDGQAGGFFFTRHDHERLIQRNKIGQDNATPSGNGIAAQALLRLTVLTGNGAYQAAAERCLKLYFPAMQQYACYHSSLCGALAESLHPPSLLVLCGAANETAAWRAAVRQHYLPDLMAVVLAEGTPDMPQPLNKPRSGQTTAWLCTGTQCLPPITRLDDLVKHLGKR